MAKYQPAILARLTEYEKAHQPACPGVFLDPDRVRHQRDRQAKFGFSAEAIEAAQRKRSQKRNKRPKTVTLNGSFPILPSI